MMCAYYPGATWYVLIIPENVFYLGTYGACLLSQGTCVTSEPTVRAYYLRELVLLHQSTQHHEIRTHRAR